MSGAGGEFLDLSRRFLDLLGAEGIGSEYEQQDYAIAGREPRWVLLPSSVAECAAALRICAEQNLAVVPAGLGLRLRQGNPLARLDVVLSTSRLARVIDHTAADLTVLVEGGASLAAVNEVLAGAGQWLPFDPPFPKRTSIGGLIAAQACGPCRQAFGTVRESLIGIRAILSDGTVVKSGGRVVKNVAGYDLQKLLVGSFGTLGIIVEASFKCQPLAAGTAGFAVTGPMRALFALAGALAASNVEPRYLELFFDEESSTVLEVGLAGASEQIAWGSGRLAELAAAIGSPAASEAGSVAARVDAIAEPDESAVVVRVGLPPAALGEWLEAALERTAGVVRRVRGHAHAGVGVARLRLEDPLEIEGATNLAAGLRSAAIGRGGYLVVEQAPADWRLDSWGPPPASVDLMRGIKAAFDSRGILSPGRFIGGI